MRNVRRMWQNASDAIISSTYEDRYNTSQKLSECWSGDQIWGKKILWEPLGPVHHHNVAVFLYRIFVVYIHTYCSHFMEGLENLQCICMWYENDFLSSFKGIVRDNWKARSFLHRPRSPILRHCAMSAPPSTALAKGAPCDIGGHELIFLPRQATEKILGSFWPYLLIFSTLSHL